jgi:two-component system response regulator YesN
MKVLLVDDEQHVREAVRMLADWDALGIDTILEAENGSLAKRFIQEERPEIIITDIMMPLSSGLDLLEWIQMQALSCKTIVISGHNDFDFVRHTVKYGGTDYLLKPLDPEQLQQALRKAVDSWRSEEKSRSQEQQRNMEMNQIKPVYLDNLLSTLLNDTGDYGRLKAQLAPILPGMCEASECRVSVLSLDTMEKLIAEKFVNRMDLLFFTLINICNEFLIGKKQGVAFRYWNSQTEIILLIWSDLQNVESIITQISRGIARAIKTQFDFGIGLTKPFPNGLKESFKEAQAALRKRNLLQPGSRITVYREDTSASRTSTLHLTDYEERVRIAIRSGKDEQIATAVDELIDAVKQLDEITVDQLELWGHEYSVLKTRWMQDLFREEEMKPDLRLPSENARYIVPMDSQGKLSIAMWHSELMESMGKLTNILQNRRIHGGEVMYDIARYLDNHYASDLTLKDLSDQFFLSREYISRKFKQQFGENIVDYISRIRVDKSKLLLLNPLLKIADVAQAVGYQDEKYFSKVFKKLEGVSPNEYRKTLK